RGRVGPGHLPRRRPAPGPGAAGPPAGGGCQTGGDRPGHAGHHGRGAGAGRGRVHPGLPGRTLPARGQGAADLRGHEPDPAHGHRPRASEGNPMKASALVTGGSGGLGIAVVEELLAAGWRAVVPWVTESELHRLPDEPRLERVRADLNDPPEVAAAVARGAAAPDAPLRALVNLVGGFGTGGRVHETPVEEFERLGQLNPRALYLATHAGLPELMARGGGSVVCVSSRAAARPFPGAAGYVTGKAAVTALADALAVEYKKDGIRVNTILPSVIDTPGNRAAQPGADFSSWVAPAQSARVIKFLIEDSSDVVSGAHIPVYGDA